MEGSGNENPAPVMAAPVQPVNLSPGHVRERPGMGPHAGMVSPGPMLERPAMAPNGMGVYAMTPMGGMGGMDDMRQLEHFMAGLSFDPAAHLNPNAREFLPPFEYPNGGPMDPMQRMPPMPRSIMMHPPMHGGMPIIYAAGPHPGAMGGPVGPRPPNMPMGIGMMPPGPQGGPMVPHMPPHRQHHQMMLPPQMQRPGGLDMKRDKKGRKMGYANQGHTNGGNQGGRRRNQNNNQSNNQNNNQNANNNSKENKDNSNNNNQGNQNQNSSNSANSNGNPSAGASAGGGSQNGQGYVQGQGGPAAGGGSNGNNSAAGMGGHPGGGKNTRAMREDSIKRTVYVSDIDQQVSEEQLAALFNQCGEVVDCRVCGDPNSVLRFAFVEFSNEEGAWSALNLAGTVLGYYPVRVLPSKTAIVPVNPTFLPRSDDEKEQCVRTVYVANIDKKVTQLDVKSFFESLCGEVSRSRLLGDYHHSTRIAFVEFVHEESALAALNCSGAILGSLPIRVSPSKTPVRSKAP